MAPKFKMDAKRFLSFKTCKFDFITNFFLDYLEKSKFFIEVLDELELFIDKKVVFDEKKISVGPPSATACRPPSAICQQIL
jgi:hypothetical protein